VIRTAVFAAAVVFAAASPALAFEFSSAPAPKDANAAPFVHLDAVMRLAPAGVDEVAHYGDAPQAKGPMRIVEVPKGKPAAHVDVNDPRDNPFMALPEGKSPPAQ
jgi:hypothetical protein